MEPNCINAWFFEEYFCFMIRLIAIQPYSYGNSGEEDLGKWETDLKPKGSHSAFSPLTSPTMCFPLMNASKPHTAAFSSKGKIYLASIGTEL